jgi:hypothetical protein
MKWLVEILATTVQRRKSRGESSAWPSHSGEGGQWFGLSICLNPAKDDPESPTHEHRKPTELTDVELRWVLQTVDVELKRRRTRSSAVA